MMILLFCLGREISILILIFWNILFVAAVQDIKKKKISNACSLAIAGVAVIAIFAEYIWPTGVKGDVFLRLAGAVCVSAVFLIISLIRPGAFGGGDIKLIAASGLFLGGKKILASAVIAIFLAGIYSIYLISGKKVTRKTRFALGPFLCIGMVIGSLWGEQIMEVLL